MWFGRGFGRGFGVWFGPILGRVGSWFGRVGLVIGPVGSWFGPILGRVGLCFVLMFSWVIVLGCVVWACFSNPASVQSLDWLG